MKKTFALFLVLLAVSLSAADIRNGTFDNLSCPNKNYLKKISSQKISVLSDKLPVNWIITTNGEIIPGAKLSVKKAKSTMFSIDSAQGELTLYTLDKALLNERRGAWQATINIQGTGEIQNAVFCYNKNKKALVLKRFDTIKLTGKKQKITTAPFSFEGINNQATLFAFAIIIRGKVDIDSVSLKQVSKTKLSNIPNNSFEKETGWILMKKSGAVGDGKVTNKVARLGKKSFKFNKTNGVGWFQLQSTTPIKVKAGKKYVFTGWFHSKNSELSTLLLFRVTRTPTEIPCYDAIDRSAGRPSQSFLINSNPGEWKKRVVSFRAEKDEEVYLNVILYGNPCTVFVDDLNFNIANYRIRPEKYERRTQFKYTEAEVLKHLAKRSPSWAKLAKSNQKVKLILNGQEVNPIMYKPEQYVENHDQNRYEEFDKAGVKLVLRPISLSWTKDNAGIVLGPGKYDFKRLEEQIMLALRRNPDANLIIEYLLYEPYAGWGDKHPNDCWMNSKGQRGYGQWGNLEGFTNDLTKVRKRHSSWRTWWYPSYSSKNYQETVCKILEDVTRYINNSPLGKAVVGFQLSGGHDCQFQYPRQDFSPAAQHNFKQWLEKRYPGKDLKNVCIPEENRKSETGYPILSPGIQVDYKYFKNHISWYVKDLFAGAIKKSANKNVIVSCYGMPVAYHCQEAVKAKNIDIITSVSWYPFRTPGYPFGAKPEKSYFLNNKLWFDELDMRSWTYPISDEVRDIWLSSARTLPAWISTNKKMTGVSLASNYGWWYYTMYRYFDAPEIMQEIKKTIGVSAELRNSKPVNFRPDVCLVKSLSSNFYNKSSFSIARDATSNPVQAFMLELSGVPYDACYLDEILSNPELQKYKVYIFQHTTMITHKQRMKINKLLKRNNKILVWLYSTGYVDESGKDAKKMSELIGMKIKTIPKYVRRTPVTIYKNPLTNGIHPFQGMGELSMSTLALKGPSPYYTRAQDFWIEDSSADTLANYHENGKTAIAVKNFSDWTSVYCAAPFSLGNRLINNIAKKAGAFTCGKPGQSINMNGNFMSLHGIKPGAYTINLPTGTSRIYDADTGKKLAKNVSKFTFAVEVGKTYWFLFKP